MSARNLSKHFGRVLFFAFGVIATGSLFSGTAAAQLSDKKTVITFTVPVEIPDAGAQVLPAGTYVFKLVDSKTDRNIVQILNRDESHVYATILAIPDFRLKATDKTVMTFAERAAGEPQAIRAWFYPGELWGQEFVYPQKKAVELAKASNLPVAYFPDEAAVNIAPVPVSPVRAEIPQRAAALPAVTTLRDLPVLVYKPTGETVQVAEVFEAPPVQSVKIAAVLPRTSSNMPLLAMIGFLCVGLGVSLPKLCAH